MRSSWQADARDPRDSRGTPEGTGGAGGADGAGEGLWRLPSAGVIVPAALDAIVEGAWIAVVYAGIESVWAGGPTDHGPLLIGPAEFALLAAAGLVLARAVASSSGEQIDARRQIAFPLALAVVAGVGGWLAAPDVLSLLSRGDYPAAVAIHPGGWLAGIAVLRGAAHPSREHDAAVVEAVLRWGIPVLALPWLAAAVASPALRALFVGPAFAATMTFVTFGLLALAIARLDALGGGAGFDWRSNRSWLAALGVLVVLLLAVAVPAAFLLGVPVTLALAGVLGPVVFVFDAAVSLLALPAGLLAGGLVELLKALQGRASQPTFAPVPQQPLAPVQTSTSAIYGVFVFLVVTILAIVAAALIARWLLGSLGARRPANPSEERAIVLPASALRLARPVPSLHLPGLPRPPVDAVGAYLATLRLFLPDSLTRRAAHETPAEHARRLRDADVGSLPFDLLAADYELARYGGRPLTRRENRRAVGRWRHIRDALRRRNDGNA